MSNQLDFIRRVVYSLKQRYGLPLTLYTTVDSVVDLETGVKSVTKTVYAVKRSILLPIEIVRKFAYDLSFVAANKNFTYGGFFDKGASTFILDRKDLPETYIFKLGDYLTYGEKRYNIKNIGDYANKQAIVILAEYVEGELLAAQHDVSIDSRLKMSQVVRGVL